MKLQYEDGKSTDTSRHFELMRSHCDGEVWGLDILGDSIYTTGDDNEMFEWSMSNHKCVKATPLLSQMDESLFK
jgi:hypothetical protein